jgi:ribosomal protein S1
MVTVLGVDLERKRISLSMKGSPPQPGVVSKTEERKKEEKRPERRQKQKSTFSNNPFVAAFRKGNQ